MAPIQVLSQRFQAVFLDNGKQLERHAVWPLRTAFPFLHGRFVGIQIMGKDRLADMMVFADLLDFLRVNLGGDGRAKTLSFADLGLRFAGRSPRRSGW